jgi:hypothetical protein
LETKIYFTKEGSLIREKGFSCKKVTTSPKKEKKAWKAINCNTVGAHVASTQLKIWMNHLMWLKKV